MLPRARSRILNRIADAVEAQDARLAELETFDTGLPITQALGQAQRAAENFRFFADLIVAQADDHYKVPGRQVNYVNRKPKGVAGLITPWNTPFMLESWKLAPALASGCTVVLKPAEFTPLSASLWASIFEEAGLPRGVFNLVNGLGESAGDALVKHPDVPLISFTGESSTGQTIFANCAANLKGMSMELGGKSPAVVFADADLDAAHRLHPVRCVLTQRRALHRREPDPRRAPDLRRVPRAVRRAREEHRRRRPPRSEDRGRRARASRALRQGDELRRDRQDPRAGSSPAVVARTTCPTATMSPRPSSRMLRPDARIFQEEIFGPVVAITPFDTDDEALELANGVRYGLAAYLWTSDLTRAHTFAQSIEAGMVWLNSHNVRDLRTPFGGVKASGLGHEGGYRSIDFYTDQQAVHITLGEVHTARFGANAAVAPAATANP